MAQSTEDYLDSLLRQAMGIPDPDSLQRTFPAYPLYASFQDADAPDACASRAGVPGRPTQTGYQWVSDSF